MSTRPPWERYAAPQAAPPQTAAEGPWARYAQPTTSVPAAVEAAPESQSLMDRWNAAAPRRAGAGKAVMNMLAGVYDVANMGPGRTGPTARELLQADPSNPNAPNITPTEAEQGGYTAANVAAFLAPTPAGKGALMTAGLNAAQSAALTHLQGGTRGETAMSGGIAAAGPLLAGAAKAGAPLLRRAAEIQYGRALNATTNRMKETSKRIVPELLDRAVQGQPVRGSLEALAERGATEASTAGREIGKAYTAASNAGAQAKTAPIISSLDKVKDRFFATNNAGVRVPVNPAAIAKVEAMQDLVNQFAPSARPDELWSLRKNIDDIIEASGGFSGPVTPGTAKALQKKSREAIQKELNSATPNMDKLNSEFSLWKGLEDVAKATLKRKEGQSGIVEIGLRAGVGSGAGLLLGDGDPKWSAVGGLLATLTKSPRYRTFSAGEKARLAHALSQGQHETAMSILSKALASGPGQ